MAAEEDMLWFVSELKEFFFYLKKKRKNEKLEIKRNQMKSVSFILGNISCRDKLNILVSFLSCFRFAKIFFFSQNTKPEVTVDYFFLLSRPDVASWRSGRQSLWKLAISVFLFFRFLNSCLLDFDFHKQFYHFFPFPLPIFKLVRSKAKEGKIMIQRLCRAKSPSLLLPANNCSWL